MGHASLLELAIHHQLARVGTCSLDELAALLSEYAWAQVFAAMDRLTRDGTVTLTHQTPFRISSRSHSVTLSRHGTRRRSESRLRGGAGQAHHPHAGMCQ